MSAEDKSSRRDLLKRALIVLGVSVLVQPNGGVAVAAEEQPKEGKVQGTLKSGSKVRKDVNAKHGIKAGSTGSGAGKADAKISGTAKTPP